jgi:hypothetical protein
VLFSVAGVAFFFLLLCRWMSLPGATAASLLLAVSPYYLYCGVAQMPEPLAYALSFAALLALDRWLEKPGAGRSLLFCILTALMLLSKPQMVFMAIPMASLVAARRGWPGIADIRLVAMALASALPVLVHGWWSHRVLSAESGVSFAQPELLRHGLLLDPGFYTLVAPVALRVAVTLPVALLALAGLLLPARRDGERWLWGWLAGGVSLFFLMPGGVSVNGYYHLALAPPAAALAGRALGRLSEGGKRWRLGIVGLLAFAAAIWSVHVALPMFRPWNETGRLCGEWVREHAAPGDRVLVASESPAALYHADREGWTCWRDEHGNTIVFGPELVARLLPQDLAWVAIPSPRFNDGRDPVFANHRSWLYDTFRAHTASAFTVFDTRLPADLSVGTEPVDFRDPDAFRLLRGPWFLTVEGAALAPCGRGEAVMVLPEGTNRARIEVSAGAPGQTLRILCDGVLLDAWVTRQPGRPVVREVAPPGGTNNAPRRFTLEADPPGEHLPVLVLHRMTFALAAAEGD